MPLRGLRKPTLAQNPACNPQVIMQSRRRVRDGAPVSEGVRGVSGQPDWGAGRVWGAARLPPFTCSVWAGGANTCCFCD